MKYLVVGDFHIKSEIDKISEKILELGKNSDGIICTGDLTSENVLKELKQANNNLIVVKGNCDFLNLPEYREFEIKNQKIGIIHSNQFGRGNIEKITNFAKSKNLDVIVFGHTHQPLIKKADNLLLLNPGTATGGLSGAGEGKEKTCAILEINEKIKVEIVEL